MILLYSTSPSNKYTHTHAIKRKNFHLSVHIVSVWKSLKIGMAKQQQYQSCIYNNHTSITWCVTLSSGRALRDSPSKRQIWFNVVIHQAHHHRVHLAVHFYSILFGYTLSLLFFIGKTDSPSLVFGTNYQKNIRIFIIQLSFTDSKKELFETALRYTRLHAKFVE